MKSNNQKNLLRVICAFAAIAVLPYSLAFASSKFEDKTTAECLKEEACQQAILSRIETRMGSLDYKAGFPTSETVERLYNEMDYQRAVLAHQLSDNLVSFYSMHTGVRDSVKGSKIGNLAIWENFLDTKADVLTGNDTTIYGMAYLDLAINGPMVVEVPKSPFLGSILDLWQVPLSGIDSKGGVFVVATEDYGGDIKLPNGAELLRSRTSIAVFFARGLVIEGDMDAAIGAVANSKIYPYIGRRQPAQNKNMERYRSSHGYPFSHESDRLLEAGQHRTKLYQPRLRSGCITSYLSAQTARH